MSFNEQEKFDPFAESGTFILKGENSADLSDMHQLQQEQIRFRNDKVSLSNLLFEHQQSHFQLSVNNDQKTVTCRYTLSLAIFISIGLSLSLTFMIVAAFTVKCDESKLKDHYEQQKSSMENVFADNIVTWQEQEIEIEENFKSQKIKWISWRRIEKDLLIKLQPAGVEHYPDRPTNETFFVARALHQNGTVVGKYYPPHKHICFGYEGKEYFFRTNFEVLLYPPGTLSWIPAKVDSLPSEEFLVFGGVAPVTGESTYICRIEVATHLVVGKYLASGGGCIVPYWNTELHQATFDILIVNEMGKLLGVQS